MGFWVTVAEGRGGGFNGFGGGLGVGDCGGKVEVWIRWLSVKLSGRKF